MLLHPATVRIIFSDPFLSVFQRYNFSVFITGTVCCYTTQAVSEPDGTELITERPNRLAGMHGWFRAPTTQAKRLQKKESWFLSVNFFPAYHIYKSNFN